VVKRDGQDQVTALLNDIRQDEEIKTYITVIAFALFSTILGSQQEPKDPDGTSRLR
jgi:hypothetical protein